MIKLFIYFIIACIILMYIVPFVMTLMKKWFYYIKIKRICKKHNYKMVSSLTKWLFSSIRSSEPEMFIQTEKAIYSIKNHGFYKHSAYYVAQDKNTIEIQIIRLIFYIGFAFLKHIKINTIKYDSANQYFDNPNLPVIHIMLFCPKCVGLVKLNGKTAQYSKYVEDCYTFKFFGKSIVKVKSIHINPYGGFMKYQPVPNLTDLETINLSNGDMLYSSYVYNIKSIYQPTLEII